MAKHNKSEESDTHAFVDKTGRFPLDALLRKHGFAIHSRKKGEETTWEKGGHVMKQSVALSLIPTKEIQTAKKFYDTGEVEEL